MEEIGDLRFSARDATRTHGEHVLREFHGYSRFATACKARLKRFATEHPTQTFLIYSVPMVIVGAALRDARAVINHIIHDLKKNGFNAHYLGSNLIFIQWKRAEEQEEYIVQDYIEDAMRGNGASGATVNVLPTVVPPTRDAIARRGPGPPVVVSESVQNKLRLNKAIEERQRLYERDSRHPNAIRRRMFDKHMSHEDALRAVTSRNVL